ncbi:SpoIIE family protein phosphatase [Streptomycetaceae bacterium NBC_01309]
MVFPGVLRSDGLPAALSDPVRLAAVAATGLMDTPAEGAFDDLAGLAAVLTGCSRAFVTLVDADRVYWKACLGVDRASARTRGTPVSEGFCPYVIASGGEPFVVADAATDPRTREHPSVGPMKIGAWAGYPILTPGGDILGSVCVVDENPHAWEPQELSTLATLARAVGNEVNLRTTLAASEAALHLSTELARSLQDSLLPPVLQKVPGVETAASYLPAAGGSTVVGDFYDLFHAQGPWWCTVMGDVCGKGVEAAKVTALARYTLRAEATRELSPAAVCANLNAALLEQRGDGRFLTAVYATFRTTAAGVSGRLCTAGHPPALILRASGRVQPLGRSGTLLGIMPDVDLTDVRFRLAPGDALLLYTDGATEARHRTRYDSAQDAPRDSPAGHFGDDALATALAACRGLDAAAIVSRIGAVLADYSGHWADDDTALLALRVPPAA